MHITKILLLAFIIVLPAKLLSQNQPDSFLKVQLTEYKLWMEYTGLGNYIRCDTLVQESEESVLYLGIKG